MSDTISSALGGITSAATSASNFLKSLTEPAWLAKIQTASWRGIPFAVESSSRSAAQRLVLHEYGFRDDGYIEAMGRKFRAITIKGFVVSTAFATCWQQRDKLVDACENYQVPGELIHPTLGKLNCFCQNLSTSESKDEGGVVALSFNFVVQADPAQLSITDTKGNLLSAAADADGNLSSWYSSAWNSIKQISAEAQAAIASVNLLQAQVNGVIGDASRIIGSVAGIDNLLGGQFTAGRFINGNLSGVNQVFNPINSVLSTVTKANQGIQLGLISVTSTASIATSAVSKVSTLIAAL